MRDVHPLAGSVVCFVAVALFLGLILDLTMFSSAYILPLFVVAGAAQSAVNESTWYAPNSTWITDLSQVVNVTGVHGFIFNSSQLPAGVPYGTYDWCNMPHIRKDVYPEVNDRYKLEYVEVVSMFYQIPLDQC